MTDISLQSQWFVVRMIIHQAGLDYTSNIGDPSTDGSATRDNVVLFARPLPFYGGSAAGPSCWSTRRVSVWGGVQKTRDRGCRVVMRCGGEYSHIKHRMTVTADDT